MTYPYILTFTVEGVVVKQQMYNCDTSSCSVTLEQLRPQTSGAYRCEISGDSPEFKLDSETSNMTVAGK